MAAEHLGDTIDIHGGGHDLIFPHHENERAQSVCAHQAKFVNYWLHNGFVNVNQEKMSKSIGNVLLVRDLLKQADGEAIRYVLLSAHYRAPLEWNDAVLIQAVNSLDRLYGALRKLEHVKPLVNVAAPTEFMQALHDDLNTPKALAELFKLAKQAQLSEQADEQAKLKAEILAAGNMLGLLQHAVAQWFGSSEVDAAHIESLIAERATAKASKDWALADKIRAQLSELNVVLEDGANGTSWRIDR
jgi:Cysteinyl-tRNA synthetase